MLDIVPFEISIQYQAARSAMRLSKQNMQHITRHGVILTSSRNEWNGTNLTLIGLPIYTEGPKMEEGTDAWVFCEPDLTEKCSVFQADIFAIMKSAELNKTMDNDFLLYIFFKFTIFGWSFFKNVVAKSAIFSQRLFL